MVRQIVRVELGEPHYQVDGLLVAIIERWYPVYDRAGP